MTGFALLPDTPAPTPPGSVFVGKIARVNLDGTVGVTIDAYGDMHEWPPAVWVAAGQTPARGDIVLVLIDDKGGVWAMPSEPAAALSPGEKWFTGSGAPAGALAGSIVGDWYLDLAVGAGNGDVYEKTGVATWTLRGNIKGATGAAGTAGEKWFTQSGAPAGATGAVNDWALDSASGDFYEKTGASTWTLRGNLKGATGATGSTGPAGTMTLGAYAAVTRVAATNYTPSATNVVLVIATLTIACASNQVGRWDVKCSNATPPTTIIASPYLYNTNASDVRERFAVTFLVPVGYSYRLESVAETGAPSFAVQGVVEALL